jgi:hypothetical protein
VVRSGGIAGLRSEAALDTQSLPEPVRAALAELVERAAFFGLAGELRTSRLPDMTQYRVRIEDDGRANEVCFDDACTDTALLELVERVAEAKKAVAS